MSSYNFIFATYHAVFLLPDTYKYQLDAHNACMLPHVSQSYDLYSSQIIETDSGKVLFTLPNEYIMSPSPPSSPIQYVIPSSSAKQ